MLSVQASDVEATRMNLHEKVVQHPDSQHEMPMFTSPGKRPDRGVFNGPAQEVGANHDPVAAAQTDASLFEDTPQQQNEGLPHGERV